MGQVVDLMVQVGVADTVCVCVGVWGGAQAPLHLYNFLLALIIDAFQLIPSDSIIDQFLNSLFCRFIFNVHKFRLD